MPGNFESLPFTVSVKPSELHKFGGNCGANCYLTMPFNKRARIEIENQGENPYIQVSLRLEESYPGFADRSTSTSTTSCTKTRCPPIPCTFTRTGDARTRPRVGRPRRLRPTRSKRRLRTWTGRTTMSS
jgi:hypothetical protein